MTEPAFHETNSARLRTIGQILRRPIQAIVRRRTERKAIRELRAVSDDLLRDIGIERSSIRTVVRQMLATTHRQERADIAAAPAVEILVVDANRVQPASNTDNLELVA